MLRGRTVPGVSSGSNVFNSSTESRSIGHAWVFGKLIARSRWKACWMRPSWHDWDGADVRALTDARSITGTGCLFPLTIRRLYDKALAGLKGDNEALAEAIAEAMVLQDRSPSLPGNCTQHAGGIV